MNVDYNSYRNMLINEASRKNITFELAAQNRIKYLNKELLYEKEKEDTREEIEMVNRILNIAKDEWGINYVRQHWRVMKGGEPASPFGYRFEWQAFEELKKLAPEEEYERLQKVFY